MFYKGIDPFFDRRPRDRNQQQKQKKVRSPFSQEEDDMLKALVEELGDRDWFLISRQMNGRTQRQCRERWRNNLCSNIVKTKWTEQEDETLRVKFKKYGPKWKFFEVFFPGRTSYNIRNRWNCLLRVKHKKSSQSKKDKNQEEEKQIEEPIVDMKANQTNEENQVGNNNELNIRNEENDLFIQLSDSFISFEDFTYF